MENKKTLVLTIVGVLVLVLAVVGVSFAMYTFTGTGSRDNVIKTGTVTIDYKPGTDGAGQTNTAIALTNQYPISDAKGSQLAEGAAQLDFAVAASMSGTMTINYELALTEITEGATLKADDIKFNVRKGADQYLVGTSATTGITVASRAANAGALVDSYLLDNGTFTQTGSVSYSIRAWVSEDYTLPQNMVNDENAGTHTNNTTSETFRFKVKVVAAQA